MNNKKRTIVLICVIGLLALLVVAGVVFLISHWNSSVDIPQPQDPTQLQTEASEATLQTQPDAPEKEESQAQSEPTGGQDAIVTPPESMPPAVVIPGGNEAAGLQFPCEVPGHDLKIEKLAPYTGLFVEDGTNQQATDVAMLLVHNTGDGAVEYAEITVEYQTKTLCFQITALPAGEKMVVQEKSGSGVPEGVALSVSALVVHRMQMSIAPEISITDNGDNSLTVKNLTNQTIPTVRIFYKHYMENEDMFVGGIAFTVRITSLGPGGSMVVFPSHYNSQTSRVVMATVYDTEV